MNSKKHVILFSLPVSIAEKGGELSGTLEKKYEGFPYLPPIGLLVYLASSLDKEKPLYVEVKEYLMCVETETEFLWKVALRDRNVSGDSFTKVPTHIIRLALQQGWMFDPHLS